MQEAMQIMARIKTLLNSYDLTNTASTKALYDEYIQLRENANYRLNLCESYLQKKMGIEAVTEANRQPELLEIVKLLDLPDMDKLKFMAELYGWKLPEEVSQESLELLRQKLQSMKGMQPLLAEYRRLARSKTSLEKLTILRQLNQIELHNTDWKDALVEEEGKYLSLLIAEAQQKIEEQDFSRVEKIYKEMTAQRWNVSIPTIVLQKMEKIVVAYHEKCRKDKAVKLLEDINGAYSSFDVGALEQLFVQWKLLTNDEGYEPNTAEQQQIKEASVYLREKQQEAEQEEKFQTILQQLTKGMKAHLPKEEIEQMYMETEGMGRQVPEYLHKRLRQYIEDEESRVRTERILKACYILGSSAIIIAILVICGNFAVNELLCRRQTSKLRVAIETGTVEEAQSILTDIEENYPVLLRRPAVSAMRSKLSAMQHEQEQKQEAFADAMERLQALLKQDDFLCSEVEALLGLAEKYIVTDVNRKLYEQIEEVAKIKKEERYSAAKQKLLSRMPQINLGIKFFTESVKQRQIEEAEKTLQSLTQQIEEAQSIPNLEPSFLQQMEFAMTFPITARKMLTETKEKMLLIKTLKGDLQRVESIGDLQVIVERCNEIESIGDGAKQLCKGLMVDIQALTPALGKVNAENTYQTGPYLEDARAYREEIRLWEQKTEELTDDFSRMTKAALAHPVFYVHYADALGEHVLYHRGNILSGSNWWSFSEVNNEPVLIVYDRDEDFYSILIGEKETEQAGTGKKKYAVRHARCELIGPTPPITTTALRSCQARHQLLLKQIQATLLDSNGKDASCIGKILDETIQDKMCAPFWKMQIFQVILQRLAPMLNVEGNMLYALKQSLEEVNKEMDAEDENPICNETLRNRLTRLFSKVNSKDLNACIELMSLRQMALECVVEARYTYAGVALKDGKDFIFCKSPMFNRQKGKMLCLDADGKACLVAGQLQDGKIEWLLPSENIAGHVIFTMDSDLMPEVAKQIMSTKQADIFPWPSFWPKQERK